MGRLGQHRDPSRGRLGHRLDQIGSLFPEIKNDKKSLVFIIIKKRTDFEKFTWYTSILHFLFRSIWSDLARIWARFSTALEPSTVTYATPLNLKLKIKICWLLWEAFCDNFQPIFVCRVQTAVAKVNVWHKILFWMQDPIVGSKFKFLNANINLRCKLRFFGANYELWVRILILDASSNFSMRIPIFGSKC